VQTQEQNDIFTDNFGPFFVARGNPAKDPFFDRFERAGNHIENTPVHLVETLYG